ncbi:anti-sigma factor family protein [Paenibacillus silviterrae]|uniref:anti-sigma factor family protein n=1 Tax=Paenibacillus silviterrae TaxID=3242194 RepID=UPI0025432A32|nr:zf-HC2 domain-containing protein [Paenibacillus chinjuensis]
MKCEDIQELFAEYWDLNERDLKRQAVDEHIKHCVQCAEEFEMWRESEDLIKSVTETMGTERQAPIISESVMKRIYQDESWRVPVGDKLYHFSYKMRRNVTAVVAFCLTLFIFTFVFSAAGGFSSDTVASQQSSVFGRLGEPVVIAGSSGDSMNVHSMPTAVASLKGFNEPFMYKVGPIQTVKDYMMFLSLLGLTCTLLIMNWLSRTRS